MKTDVQILATSSIHLQQVLELVGDIIGVGPEIPDSNRLILSQLLCEKGQPQDVVVGLQSLRDF